MSCKKFVTVKCEILNECIWTQAVDQNNRLRSTKLFSRWSVSVEQSAAGNQDVTDTRTVLWQVKTDMMFLCMILRVSAAVIIFYYKTAWNINRVTGLNWTELNKRRYRKAVRGSLKTMRETEGAINLIWFDRRCSENLYWKSLLFQYSTSIMSYLKYYLMRRFGFIRSVPFLITRSCHSALRPSQESIIVQILRPINCGWPRVYLTRDKWQKAVKETKMTAFATNARLRNLNMKLQFRSQVGLCSHVSQICSH